MPSVGAIGVTIALLLPLDTWEAEHTARYPDGVDLIPRKDPSDLILRGEWEENARRTANQIGLWTIAIADRRNRDRNRDRDPAQARGRAAAGSASARDEPPELALVRLASPG